MKARIGRALGRAFQTDLVLIHPPSLLDFRTRRSFTGPIADVVPSSDQFDMYPVGLTSIAAHLERNSYNVRIVNLASRMLRDPGFDPEAYLTRLNAPIYGIDLHWLPHAEGALQVAALLKRLHPGCSILLGGLSASYYHQELINSPDVDFVLRGDSTEDPCRQLLQAVREGRPLEGVENLTWKRPGGEVIVNQLSYVPADIDSFDLPAYEHLIRSVVKYRNLEDHLPYADWLRHPTTVLFTSRGCTLECAICGGSQSAYASICGRLRPAFRSPEKLVEDVRVIRSFSRGPIFMVHDPRLGGARRMRRLFELLEQERLPNELVLELFFPANDRFFELLDRSLPAWSLQLTLETQDEALRRRNGKFACPNELVEETIALALRHRCRKLDIFFMTGLPGQTPESARGIGAYCEALLQKFDDDPRLCFFAAPLGPFLDPGSRAFEDRDLGVKSLARTVAEHRTALRQPSWPEMLTYETDSMTRTQIAEATYEVAEQLNDLKCRRGQIDDPTHRTVRERLRSARHALGSKGELFASSDAAEGWMLMKEELSWNHRGFSPSTRLASIVLLGLALEIGRIIDRIRGRYDTQPVPAIEPSVGA